MPVLKSAPAPGAFEAFSMNDIEREAQAVLRGAEHRARAIVDRAKAEAGRVLAEAKERGFDAGHAEGESAGREAGLAEGRAAAYAEAKAETADLATAMEGVLRAFNADREDLAARAGREVPTLAVAIADRVIKRAATLDESACVANATAALRLVMRAHDVRLSVHPDDAEAIRRLLPELGRRWPAMTHVELVEDAEVSRGGCVVRTEGGLVDADLRTQLDRIAADLLPGEQE